MHRIALLLGGVTSSRSVSGAASPISRPAGPRGKAQRQNRAKAAGDRAEEGQGARALVDGPALQPEDRGVAVRHHRAAAQAGADPDRSRSFGDLTAEHPQRVDWPACGPGESRALGAFHLTHPLRETPALRTRRRRRNSGRRKGRGLRRLRRTRRTAHRWPPGACTTRPDWPQFTGYRASDSTTRMTVLLQDVGYVGWRSAPLPGPALPRRRSGIHLSPPRARGVALGLRALWCCRPSFAIALAPEVVW